jgi:hypothetical protein
VQEQKGSEQWLRRSGDLHSSRESCCGRGDLMSNGDDHMNLAETLALSSVSLASPTIRHCGALLWGRETLRHHADWATYRLRP